MMRSALSNTVRRSLISSHAKASSVTTARFLSSTPTDEKIMYDVVPKEDYGDFKEFSVILRI